MSGSRPGDSLYSLYKENPSEKWFLGTGGNTGLIQFKGQQIEDSAAICRQAKGNACQGQGYMYCAGWDFAADGTFSVSKDGAFAQDKSATFCSVFRFS